MSVRFDDLDRTVQLSVHDVLEAGMPRGNLVLEVLRRSWSRLEAGRQAHIDWQGDRGRDDEGFQAEVSLKHQVVVRGWTVTVRGRVDGLSEENGLIVVEELKSTALEAGRLHRTTLDDWGAYAEQLRIYLWMLQRGGRDGAMGRLVLVSLADGSRQVLPVPFEVEAVEKVVLGRLDELVEARERRNGWLAERKTRVVPVPFGAWRPGQAEVALAVASGVERGAPVFAQAPTGLGKTAAVLAGALRVALGTGRQVFWATSRTTQQPVVVATVDELRRQGLPLRVVVLSSKEKVCPNDVVACRPEACRFAKGHFDKIRSGGVLGKLREVEVTGPEVLVATGLDHEVCPWQLALDIVDEVDVVVGDHNYAFDPSVELGRCFGEDKVKGWVVVADEAHSLPERARSFLSAQVDGALARRVSGVFESHEAVGYGPFAKLAAEIGEFVDDAVTLAGPPGRDGWALSEPSHRAVRELATRIDEVGLDYARLKADQPLYPPGEPDDWLDLARSILRYADQIEENGESHVAIARPSGPTAKWLCLDPSRWLGSRIERFGGFVAASATLTPTAFHRDLLGIPEERLEVVSVPSPFPPENRPVWLCPQVSTEFRLRAKNAPKIARILSEFVLSTPGNVALYFPSFAMLGEVVGKLAVWDREILAQEPSMDEVRRREWLGRLSAGGTPVVLAAVLGGIFAEGLDLPAGALRALCVVGPALPPVGLERDLLQDLYERRFGDGFGYASRIPGMTRVIQAAGRLVRRPEDRGVVLLLDARFRRDELYELIPVEWNPGVVHDPAAASRAFWGES